MMTRRRRRLARVRLDAVDLTILQQRTGPMAEREYRRCDTDDYEVAVLRLRAGGIVRSIAVVRS